MAAVSGVAIAVDHWTWHGDDWSMWDRQRVVVENALSGDSVRVRSATNGKEIVIRLLGLESPGKAARRIGWTSAELAGGVCGFFAANVGQKPVMIRLEAPQTREAEGELRAYLYLSDAEDLNVELVQNGLAVPDQSNCSMMALLVDAQILAKKNGAGVWQGWERPPGPRSRLKKNANAVAPTPKSGATNSER